MISGGGAADPFNFRAFGYSDTFGGYSFKNTSGLTRRSPVINPAQETLVLTHTGQSNGTSVLPTYVAPTNASVIDQLNVYDGQLYSVNGPLLGCTADLNGAITGHIGLAVADWLISQGYFNRVIIAALAVGSTDMNNWAAGDLANRLPAAIKRLAALGITPSTTGAYFANLLMIGEDDGAWGTTQAAWQASFGVYKANAIAAGFSGRFFVPQETYVGSGVTSSTIRAAQAAVRDNVTVFSGGDLDTLTTTTNRVSDGVHFNNVGGAAAATTVIGPAMHASGAPY